MCAKSYVIYQGSDDWSALYEDGKLVRVSDHYLIEEELHARLGIEVVQSDSFLQGGSHRGDAANTLGELHSYEERQAAAETEAARLRGLADELLKQASSYSPS